MLQRLHFILIVTFQALCTFTNLLRNPLFTTKSICKSALQSCGAINTGLYLVTRQVKVDVHHGYENIQIL